MMTKDNVPEMDGQTTIEAKNRPVPSGEQKVESKVGQDDEIRPVEARSRPIDPQSRITSLRSNDLSPYLHELE